MGALFGILTLIAFIWCIVVNVRLHNSATKFLPPQFQDDLSSRHAFPLLALSHPMPLSLQAEYVRLIKGGCVAILCGTLTLFSFNQIVFGCLGLAAFLVSVFKAIKGAKTYQQNCERARFQKNEHSE